MLILYRVSPSFIQLASRRSQRSKLLPDSADRSQVCHHAQLNDLHFNTTFNMALNAAASNTSSLSYASPSSGHASSTASAAMSPELEQTLASLSSHRSVLGYMLLSRGHPAAIIRHSGVIFEGEQGRKYASAISRIVETVRVGLEEVNGSNNDPVRVNFFEEVSIYSNTRIPRTIFGL